MTAATWIVVAAGMISLAAFWLLYLIKIVLNDENMQERIRQIQRRREEKRREEEDRIRRRQAEAQNMAEGVEKKIQESTGAPPPAPDASPQGTTEA